MNPYSSFRLNKLLKNVGSLRCQTRGGGGCLIEKCQGSDLGRGAYSRGGGAYLNNSLLGGALIQGNTVIKSKHYELANLII